MTERDEPAADVESRVRRRGHDLDEAAAGAGDELAVSVNRTIDGAQPADGEDAHPADGEDGQPVDEDLPRPPDEHLPQPTETETETDPVTDPETETDTS